MRNFLFIILGIIIIVSLIFLLGYLVGRGYELREESIVRPSGRKAEEREVSKPHVAPKIPSPKADLLYTIQVASSQSEEKALALVNRLKAQSYPAYIEEAEIEGKKWFRVRVGTFRDRDDALELVATLKEKEGLRDALVWKRRESGKVRK